MVQENLFINLIFLEQLDPWLDPYYYLPNPQHDITGSGIAEAIEIYMRLKIKKICAINYKSKKTYGAPHCHQKNYCKYVHYNKCGCLYRIVKTLMNN